MTVFSILNTILIGPLKLAFEFIFDYAYQLIGSSGGAIIFLSLVMNILVYPLYQRADVMQKQIQDKETKLHDGVTHIKKTFSGDERMMILQTYYRQNHYKPTDSIKGSVSLLLQIPFFMAAYQFLSTPGMLKGDSFGIIGNLGSPDNLLSWGGVTINLLPIIMTIINMFSSAIYLKGSPFKTKLQLYAMALFFLIFLYSSPSGLVLYWTLNNVFSLIKNIYSKRNKFKKILGFIIYIYYFIFLVYETSLHIDSFIIRELLIAVGHLPLIFLIYSKKKMDFREKENEIQSSHRVFVLGSVFLTILTGLLIPAVYITASPQEYVNISSFFNPLWYIVSALSLAIGNFMIWMQVFYWLANQKGKMIFSQFVWIMCGIMLINYMFFGTNLGVISSALQYENGMSFSWQQQLLNLLILAVLTLAMYFCFHKWKRIVISILTISIIALGIMTSFNIITIKSSSIDEMSSQESNQGEDSNSLHIQLSRTGHNVIVLMLDRAMGEYIPYIFNEKPEMQAQFSGFTYYENTISFGGHTRFGVPSLLGGYEYTPVEMNKRNTELMVSKHNEALKVTPAIFLENGYNVTVCDPPYANYQWIPDLSIYDDYPDIKTYITKGMFDEQENINASIENTKRNFFCFSIMKGMPLFLQPAIYNNGQYHQVSNNASKGNQFADSISLATGMSSNFTKSYNVLVNLPNMTEITENVTNTFLFLANDTTHEPVLLQEPDYTPSHEVDNVSYDSKNKDRFIIGDRELKVETIMQMSHYHANIAALIRLGVWFDYLREHDAYDNTRIILVSDHGYNLAQSDELTFEKGYKNVEYYYPLLMVKDFNSREFVTSDEFMTNADVPTLAMNDIIPNPVNPFTGKVINNDEKYAHEQFIILSNERNTTENNGNTNTYTYSPSKWASVKDNIWDKTNWTFFDEETVLDEHTAP